MYKRQVYVNISEGDEAGVMVSSVSDEMIQGKISSMPAAANAQTSLYDVSVSLPSDVKPPIGAFATVTFYTCLLYTSSPLNFVYGQYRKKTRFVFT